MKKQIPSVLMIYTGGTIGMITDSKTGILKPFDFNHLSNQIPELNRLNVSLEAISFEKPIDSSEMNLTHWKKIANTVFENYAKYDGFVILHGSDTMAYTASALSFMLQNLKKPVILTGSQLPIGTIRTDGKENLITSIEIAAAKNENNEAFIQEVAIYFEYSLYRGNRTSKISASQFEAFSSPNFPELAVAGVNIEYKFPLEKKSKKDIKLFTDFSDEIALLKLYPGINFNLYKSLFDFNSVKGIILESYGSGNIPSDDNFKNLIIQFLNNGGVILNITQCNTGSVNQGKYETSSFLSEIGVIGGNDLTTEAAVTKLMYLIGKYKDRKKIIKKLKENCFGEMTLK